MGSGAAQDATGAASSITLNLSAAPQANDQILLAVDYKQGQNPAAPAGYVSLGTFSGSGIQNSRLNLYRKTATGSEGTSIQVGFAATPVHTKAVAAVVYRGVDPASPIDVVGTAGSAAAATSVTAPSITTGNADEQLLMVMSALGPVTTLGATWTQPAGMEKRVQSGPNVPAVALAIADKTLGAAGATGNQTATLSEAEDLIGIHIALKMPPPALVYFHQDELGSTRVLTNSAGSIVATYTFDAYGNTTAKTGAAATPLQYAGQYTDAETGYQYLRARYFDSSTGQFVTRDPLEPLTSEPYAYVKGNPLNAVDPTGLEHSGLFTSQTGNCGVSYLEAYRSGDDLTVDIGFWDLCFSAVSVSSFVTILALPPGQRLPQSLSDTFDNPSIRFEIVTNQTFHAGRSSVTHRYTFSGIDPCQVFIGGSIWAEGVGSSWWNPFSWIESADSGYLKVSGHV